MSIMSSRPAEVSGRTGIKEWLSKGWKRMRRSAGEGNEGENHETCSPSSSLSQVAAQKLENKGQETPRFAVELDGLYCFETIVTH